MFVNVNFNMHEWAHFDATNFTSRNEMGKVTILACSSFFVKNMNLEVIVIVELVFLL